MADSVEHVDPEKRPIDVHEEYRRTRRNAMVWLGLTALAPFALGPDACERFGLPASDVDLPAAIVLYALAIIALFNLASHVRADIYLRRAHGPDLFSERWKDADALMAKIASRALTVDNELGAASKSAEGYEKRVAKELKLVSDTAREQIENLRNPRSAFGRALRDLAEYGKNVGRLEERDLVDKEMDLKKARSELGDAIDQVEKESAKSHDAVIRSLQGLLAAADLIKNDRPDRERAVKALEKVTETRMGLRKFHDDISRSDRGFYWTLDAGPLIGLFLAAALTFTLQVLEFENAPIFCPAQANVPPSQ